MSSLAGIHHVQVAAPAGCEAEARAFYGDVLDLPEIDKPALLATRGGCWFRVGANELHVGIADPFVPATKAHPALAASSVAELDALADRLAASGIDVRWADDSEIPGQRRFHVDDPWGNRIEILAEAR